MRDSEETEFQGRNSQSNIFGDYNEEMMQIRERLQLNAHNAPGPAKAFSLLKTSLFLASFIQSILQLG